MRWEITTDSAQYFLTIEAKNADYIKDTDIAQILSLSLEEYQKILIDNNAILYRGEYYFKNRRDTKNTIKTLQPYFIMATLTEE